jgi:hypothetical protein
MLDQREAVRFRENEIELDELQWRGGGGVAEGFDFRS